MRRFFVILTGFSLFLAVLLTAACSSKPAQSSSKVAVPVSVATVEEKSAPVEVRTIGTVEAYSTVSIKAQISAEVMGVHFREGQDVKEGDLLFTLDRRAYDAALQQAEANLARDIAQMQDAQTQAARAQKLNEQGIIAKEQYDTAKAKADALEAAVRADRAAVENARVQLSYCSIYAPISGRTGSLLVHKGNLVKANDNPALLVINQIQPIYVEVALPQQYLSDVKKYMAAGRLGMRAYLPDDKTNSEGGILTFVDNAVDTTTGTIKVKATFANPRRRLWPGLFVDTVLTLTVEPRAIVVPAQAVQTGQSGQFVFVVKGDMTVEMRPVETVRTLDGETVIRKGLQAGEQVVTDGQLRLVPGAKVELKAPVALRLGLPLPAQGSRATIAGRGREQG